MLFSAPCNAIALSPETKEFKSLALSSLIGVAFAPTSSNEARLNIENILKKMSRNPEESQVGARKKLERKYDKTI